MSRHQITYNPPAYLRPGSELTVSLGDSADHVRATVLHHLPFTWNQVAVCELKSKSTVHPRSLPCGARFVLKIFDPRYLPRTRRDAPQWSYAAEREAFPLHKGQLTKWVIALGPEFVGLENWEEFYFLMSKTYQTNEIEAYQCLAPLQGSAVPNFYGHGHLDLSVVDPQRTVHPPVILIEYIDNAVTLKDVDVRLLDPKLIRSFIDTVGIMGSFGVQNNDLNPGNFLFSPSWKPTRMLLIDWANAVFRDPQTSDEQWEDEVEMHGAQNALRWLLGRRYTDAGLPIPPFCSCVSANS